MHIANLVEVIEYIIDSIEEQSLIQKYQHLVTSLNQVRQNPNPNFTNQLQEAKKDVISINELIEPANWNYSKLKLYGIYNSEGLIGINANQRIIDSFEENQANPTGVAQEVQIMINELTELKNEFENIQNTLEPIFDEFVEEEIPDDKSLLYLFFENEVEIETIKELEKASTQWNRIIKGFARLAKDSTEAPRIHSVEKGSLILGIIAGATTVVAIAKGVSQLLEVYKKVLEIRKLQLETKKLKLDGDIDKQFEKRIESIIEESAQKAVEKLTEELGETDDRNEVKNAVSLALKDIFSFVEKGGRIDYQEKEETKTSKAARKKLNRTFQKVKEIETDIETMKKLPMSKDK